MPVTKWSTAGTGWQNASIAVHDVVLTSADVRNSNEGTRAEAALIRIYRGPQLETTSQNFDTLASGWAFAQQSLTWTGRIVLNGDFYIVGRVNHANSVSHALTVQYEKIGPPAARGWEAMWRNMWGLPL